MWLGGCSGCHMSFLDLDEFLIDLADKVDLVYSPVVDTKEYPEGVDVALIEGAICNEENLELIHKIRQRTKVLVSFGDCAVTANVPAMRDPLPDSVQAVLKRSYLDGGDLNAQLPVAPGIVPPLTPRVMPIHAVVPVDVFLPGCPPPAGRIRALVEQLLAGEGVKLEGRELIKFG
jgi:NAD-reducing hydrogenase small subunit